MGETKKETSEGTEVISQTEQYNQTFKHGTEAKMAISIELTNDSQEDFQEIMQFIGVSSRRFYLTFGNKFNNKP